MVDLNGLWPWNWDWEEIWRDIQNISRTVDIFFGLGRNRYGLFNLVPGAELADLRYYSSLELAENNGFVHDNGRANARGNLPDAYRHFTWMFEETSARGARRARVLGDHNERVDLNTLFIGAPQDFILARIDLDSIKDLWNNSAGIELGSCPEHAGMDSEALFWYHAAPYLSWDSVTGEPIVAQSDNPFLILDENHVPDILGIVPDSNGEVLAEWDQSANNIRLIDNYGVTTLCLYTREHTREPF